MGNAEFCPSCGEITGGWQEEEDSPCQCITGVDSNGRVVDHERLADYVIEQLDFATDATVEASRYFTKAFHMTPLLGGFTPFDAARIRLAMARAEEEVRYLVCGETETSEQVRSQADDSGRDSVRVEAGGGAVPGTPCPCGCRGY